MVKGINKITELEVQLSETLLPKRDIGDRLKAIVK